MKQFASLIILIILISICEMIGQSCLKYYHTNDTRPHYCLYALLFYAAVCYLLVKSYNYIGIGLVNVLWSGMSILIMLVAGSVFFGETITTIDKFGSIFVIVGIILILYEGDH